MSEHICERCGEESAAEYCNRTEEAICGTCQVKETQVAWEDYCLSRVAPFEGE
jgi:hypothetical protein